MPLCPCPPGWVEGIGAAHPDTTTFLHTEIAVKPESQHIAGMETDMETEKEVKLHFGQVRGVREMRGDGRGVEFGVLLLPTSSMCSPA